MNILSLLKHLLLDQFLFHCGGGGGGDGGAADRERARQARIDQATRAVNSLFGKGAKSDAEMESMRTELQRQRAMAANPQPRGGGVLGGRGMTQAISNASVAGLEQQIADEERNRETNRAAAAAREQIYGQVGADTRDYFSGQLAEDAEAAQRDLRFTQARNGTLGSSQAIDMRREFDRRNDRGLIDVANRADSAVSGLKSADERARIDLISRIVNGADQASATQSALSQLSTNAETAKQNAQGARMSNVFAGLADAWKQNQVAQGEEAARQKFMSEFGAYFTNGGNGNQYAGTVSR